MAEASRRAFDSGRDLQLKKNGGVMQTVAFNGYVKRATGEKFLVTPHAG